MSGRHSIHTVIKEAIPGAVIVSDILLPPAFVPPVRRSAIAKVARTVIDLIKGNLKSRMPGNGVTAKQRLQINTKGNTNFVALMGAMQVVSMANAFGFKAAVLSPEPKTQHEAMSRPDVQDWIEAEWIEMDTVYCMGTIEYVLIADLPACTSLIPTKFAYKCNRARGSTEGV
eukprot:2368587-Rhodomonas_salina.1